MPCLIKFNSTKNLELIEVFYLFRSYGLALSVLSQTTVRPRAETPI